MFLWCHSDVNCRLDMCRRQYANDACNRGTAGNFEWIRCASTAGWTSHTHIILKSLSTSLSLSLCSSVLCVLQYFCQQPKKILNFIPFSTPLHEFYSHIRFMCVLAKTVSQTIVSSLTPPTHGSLSGWAPAKNCFQWFITVFHSILLCVYFRLSLFSHANVLQRKKYSVNKNTFSRWKLFPVRRSTAPLWSVTRIYSWNYRLNISISSL